MNGKVIISKFLKSQIDFFHSKIKNLEWSGILLYKQTKGDFDTLKDLEFFAVGMYLMNKGSAGYTDFTVNEGIVKAYKYLVDNDLEYLNGFIHSHHIMNTFFSGTDISELRDNAPHYNFYLSLIVNMEGTYLCKLAIPSKNKSIITHYIKDATGKEHSYTTEEETVSIIEVDLDVKFEEENIIPDWVKENLKEIESLQVNAPFHYVNPNNKFFDNTAMGNKFLNTTVEREVLGNAGPEQVIKDYYNLMDNSDANIKRYALSLLAPEEEMAGLTWNLNFNTLTDTELKNLIVKSLPKNEKEWAEYEELLTLNLEIIHENVFYNTDNIIQNTVKVIELFRSLSKKVPKLNRIIEMLNSELEEYGLLY